MTLEELKVIISAETSQFSKALKSATNEAKFSADSIRGSTNKIGKSVSGIKSIISKAIAGIGLYKLGKEAIEVASNIAEVQNVVDTAFGEMAWKVERFAQNSIKQFGMSELSAKKTASTYMAMASGMGLGADKASDMAISLAGLSGDVASFYNISQELADTKLKSVFTGETETLKDLGIVMTQTNLQQYALSKGIQTSISDMNQAQLTTLRYNYVLDKLSLAQGDFAKTSGTWANQIRILQEQFKQLLGIIGNGFIAALTPVIQVINLLLGKLVTLANVITGVFSKLFGSKTETSSLSMIGNTSDAFSSIGDSARNSANATKKAAKEMKGSLAGFDELNVLKSASNSSSNDTDSGSLSSGGYHIEAIDWNNTFGEPDTSGIDSAIDKIIEKLNVLKKWLTENKNIIISLITGIATGFLVFETIMKWSSIIGVLSSIVAPIQLVITQFSVLFASVAEGSGLILGLETAFGTIAGPAALVAVVIGTIVASLTHLYQTSESFRNLVNEAVGNLFVILMNFYNTVLKPLFTFLLDIFNTIVVPIATFIAKVVVKAVEAVATIALSFWNKILSPIAKFLVNVLAIALQGVLNIWKKWKPYIEGLFNVLQWLWDSMLSPLVDFIVNNVISVFENWGSFIEELIPSIEEIFSGLIDFFVGIFTLDINKCWEGITEIFEGFTNFLSSIFSTDWTNVLGALGRPLNSLCEFVTAIWNMIKGIFNGIITFVKGVFTGDWKKAWEGVKTIFGSVISGIGNIFKIPLNAIIDGINSFIKGINKIKIPDWVPGVGGKGFSIAKIPRLAQGGIISQSTIANIGEAGAEAVIPLKRNTQGIEMIADKLLENMPSNESQGMYLIQLVLEDGTVLAKKLIKNIKEYEIMTGKPAF